MTQNVIIMIGDGMGWEMARAAAIYKQIQEGATGSTLGDYYTAGMGAGLSFQALTNYALTTTYGTTIADAEGVFSTGNSALDGSESVTAGSSLLENFFFDPSFNPGTEASGGATVADGATGNLVGYDPVQGGEVPWDPAYYGGLVSAGFDPEYIKASYPDSANTATTLYTGVKSYNNAIGVDIFEQPLESILVTAALNGLSTGLVSSVPIDHATPGAAAAAVNRRSKYDGEYPEIDNILQQELGIYQPTVLLGGGHPLSSVNEAPLPEGVEPDFTYITEETYNYLTANPTDNRYGYTFLERGTDAAESLANTAAEIDPNTGERLLGLYGARGQNGNLPVSSADGDYSTTGLDLFTVFSTEGQEPDTERPLEPGETDASFIARETNENPTLEELSTAALDVLGKDEDGFWLMIEGGDIDWSAHDDNIDNLIGTTLDFDKSVASVIDWIENNGGWEENLLLVTADHDHYLTLNPNYPELLQTQGAEALTDLDTPAEAGHFWGSDPTVKYGWGSHTNRPVPVYYQGAGAEVLDSFIGQGFESYGYDISGLPGHVDQSQIYQTMLAAITGSTEKPTQDGPQTFIGTDEGDVVYTGAFDDTIYALDGTNYLYANQGDNVVYGGADGDLVYAGFGNDLFYLNQGANAAFSGAGNDSVYGGNGDDQVYAGAGDDLINATGGNNIVWAGGGNDFVSTRAGDDEIDTGAGDDFVYAGAGSNTITTGLGNDTIYIGAGINTFILDAGEGAAIIHNFGVDDVVSLGSGFEETDTLTVAISGNDTLISTGDDLLATLKGVQLESVPIV